MVSREIVQIIETNINALRDKIRGVEPFYMDEVEDDHIDWDDPLDDEVPTLSEVGVSCIFESGDTVEAEVEWDSK